MSSREILRNRVRSYGVAEAQRPVFNGSGALPTTSMSGSPASASVSIFRTMAQSSTTSTLCFAIAHSYYSESRMRICGFERVTYSRGKRTPRLKFKISGDRLSGQVLLDGRFSSGNLNSRHPDGHHLGFGPGVGKRFLNAFLGGSCGLVGARLASRMLSYTS